jgi:hypothetical protein
VSVEENSHIVCQKNSLMRNELWDGELSLCRRQFLCRQSSERNLRTFPRSRRKTSQQYEELTVWLARPSDRRLSAKLVPHFADRGCHVFSVTDPYDRILGFSQINAQNTKSDNWDLGSRLYDGEGWAQPHVMFRGGLNLLETKRFLNTI